MATITVRMNEDEIKVLDYLTKHFKNDRSTMLKRSIMELYEDTKDNNFIDKYHKQRSSKVFLNSTEFLKQLDNVK